MKACFAVIILILLQLPCAASAGQRMDLYTDTFPPYYYPCNSGTCGIIYEVLSLAFKELKIPFSITHIPWKRAVLMAETGSSDGIPGVVKSSKRTKKLIFPEEPLVTAEFTVFHRKNENFKYTGLSSLKGMKVGTIRGYSYGDSFDNNSSFTKIEGESLEQNFQKLAAGRIDCVVTWKAVGLYKLQQMPIANQITYAAKPICKTNLYIAFSPNTNNRKLIKKFSSVLKKIKKTKDCSDAISRLKLPAGTPNPCN